MSERLLKVLPLGVFGSLLAVLTAGFSPAQEPIPLLPPVPKLPAAPPDPVPLPLPVPGQPVPAPADPADGVEVLAKGPVHEAFATTAEPPGAAPIVAKQPPEPIEELPPDQKPAGDNVQWIPGYWHWDEEASKFIWISGFWRQPPPGRVWVPGSWREARGGWRWVSGFWQDVRPVAAQPNQQVQPEIEYLPQQPPASIEVGPTVPAPGEAYFYVPGSWVWRNRYVWRPGVWVEHRANWLWVPARYHWTPAGYVFCDGYWDYPLATRGILFAPVAFARPIRPAFVYTPLYVVSEPCLVGALFTRRGCGNYFFGDYFDRGYTTLGYSAWCGTYSRAGFSIGFGGGRAWGYDPLWSYYSVAFRDTPTWQRGVGDLYGGRFRGDIVRPPATLVQQNTVINNFARVNVNNVTNNITVVHGSPTVNNRDVSNVAMIAPLRVAPDLNRTKFEAVSADTRRNEAVAARQLRDVGTQRTRLEAAAVPQPAVVVQPTPGQPQPAVAAAQPRSIKLDVPQAAVVRAQVSDEKKAPPPNPLRSATAPGAKVDPKLPANSVVNPITLPKVDPKLPGINPQPGPAPKVDPPRVNPLPKVDPKLPVTPKVDPPRVNPPVVVPKADPPKIDPKLPVTPNPLPKVDPPRINPAPQPKVDPPVVLPKVNPAPAPIVVPKADPPKVNPLPAPAPAPKINPTPAPAPPAPKVNPAPAPIVPKIDPPRVNPAPAPKVNPAPAPAPIVLPKADPPRVNPAPAPAPIVLPKVNPAPVPAPVAPKVNPAPAPPAPKVNPAPAPIVNPPKINPAPAQPRPAAVAPAAQPPKVVQPPRAAPAPPPKAAPPGNPPAKKK